MGEASTDTPGANLPSWIGHALNFRYIATNAA